jgi:MoaA/NifB/PqqE/SkfB family radical SAM enzyme
MKNFTIARSSVLPLLKAQPASYYIEVTKNCNELCQICPRTYYWPHRRDNLSLEQFYRIVDGIEEVQRVVLHGLGEPLLNPDLFEMVRYLKARGAYVLFNSNALALNERRRLVMLESGLDEYRVSLDAAQPDTYKKIRGIAGLNKVQRNLLALTAAMREQGPGPKVSLWFTTMRENVTELPDVVRFAAGAGISEVYVQRLVYFNKGLAVEEQSLYKKLEEQAQVALAEAYRLCGEYGILLAASGGEQVLANGEMQHETLDEEYPWRACTRPWRLMYIQANGDISPCCFAPFTGLEGGPILGNAFKRKIEDIWHGEPYRKFRENFLSSQPNQCCEGCGARWSV